MAEMLLADALRAEIGPLVPAAVPRPKSERPRVENGEALLGILFVLSTPIPGERLPFEVAGWSGITSWRRLGAWQDAGLWGESHRHMMECLNIAGEIDGSRASVDAPSVPAKRGRRDGPEPDRARQAGHQAAHYGRSKGPSSRSRPDRRQPPRQRGADRDGRCRPPPVGQWRGGSRKRPDELHADERYDFKRGRKGLHQQGITHPIARRGIGRSTHLGKHRWVVEHTFAWVNQFRGLAIRRERHADLYRTFLVFAAAIICFRAVTRFC